ncbi:MAG: hypothetical protein JJU41_00715 [Bacteroidetes bacterium]|nr:hypothetical protein [Bacteroidota bacterium]
MKLTIVSGSKGLAATAKVTIYSNGHLSFNKSAALKLDITQGKDLHVALAVDDQHKPEQKLFLVFFKQKTDDTRKIVSTDKSHLINFSTSLDALSIDYKKTRYVYEITNEDTWNGQRVIVLDRIKK